ncbi:MAG: hypothetical protein JSS46_04645, partial [Proteobacteria bacterium]|nr:hypothetical protein [Pseudomonadota bacterium]
MQQSTTPAGSITRIPWITRGDFSVLPINHDGGAADNTRKSNFYSRQKGIPLRRTIPPIFLALAAMLVLPAMALGATANVTGTLTGSTLSLSTSATPSFSANLDLGDSTPTYTVPLTIQDTRGTGAGWNATITSTQFTTGGATPSLLATNASTITGVT